MIMSRISMKHFGLALSLMSLTTVRATGSGVSIFSSQEVETGIHELYALENNSRVAEFDRAAYRESLAELLALMPIKNFNDVTAHLLADYFNNPSHRVALESFAISLSAQVAPEISRRREIHPITTVMDDVFAVWITSYSFGFGKGLWKSRSLGLKNVESFKKAVEEVGRHLPKGRRTSLGITAGGGAIGLAHVLYQSLETFKLDPLTRLHFTQKQRIEWIAKQIREIDSQVMNHKPSITLENWDALSRSIKSYVAELNHFQKADVAPQFRGLIQPLLLDIRELEQRLTLVRQDLIR